MSRSLTALGSLVLAAAGCRDTTSAPTRNVGLFTIEEAASGSLYKTRPAAAFYKGNGLSLIDAANVTSACGIYAYPDAPPDSNSFAGVNAGSFVTAAVDTSTRQLAGVSRSTGGLRTYTLAPGDSMVLTPGDTITFTIPGAPSGFAASVLKVKTAEPFTFTPVPTAPPAGVQTLTLTWTAGPAAGSAMLASLRYASSTSTILDRQISCVLVDNGSASIDGLTAKGWYQSTAHQARFTRIRTAAGPVGNDVLAGISFYGLTATY